MGVEPVDVDIPPVPPVVHIVPVTREIRIVVGLVLAALLLLSGGVIFASRAAERSAITAERTELSAECRFDENAEISDVNDRIDLWTARGLAASVRGDQDGVNEALTRIDHLSTEFERLIDGRSEIVERCDQQGG